MHSQSKQLGLGLGVLACLAFYAACASTTTSTPDGGSSGGPDGSTTPTPPGSGVDGGDGGPTVELPKPVFCPEADPFSPKLPNSVVVSDIVLKADTTWTADKVYLVGDDFKIQGHKLTVEAGTTICLYQNGKIFVGQGIDPGEIHLNGTADKPIVITAPASKSDPTKPDVFHKGIQFDTYQGSSISYVNIWYGGPGGGSSSPPFEITSGGRGSDPKKPLLVDHLTVGAVQARGVRLANSLGVADGSKIRFTGFVPFDASGPALQSAAEVELSAIKSFSKAFDWTGAPIPDAAKQVLLRSQQSEGKIQTDTEIFDVGLPYLWVNQLIMQVSGLQDDPIGPTLTIHEGVTMKMSGALIIGGTSGTANGNLVVAGTAAKPVVFTSTAATPASGDWEGLYFVGSHYDPAKTKIDNAQILYAGVDPSNGQQINHHVGRCGNNAVGAVMITTGSAAAPYPGPVFSNLKIAHSLSDGIVSDSGTLGNYLSTDYNKPDITFDDVKGTKINTAACP